MQSLRKWRFFYVDENDIEVYGKSHRRTTRAPSPSRHRPEHEGGAGAVRSARIANVDDVPRGAPRGDDLAVMAHLEQMVTELALKVRCRVIFLFVTRASSPTSCRVFGTDQHA